jgi:SAM-dependent methyltransferase
VSCSQTYPIFKGTPVMFPDGDFPEVQHESELVSLGTYYPWIHRIVMQSLLDNQVVIEIGAGNVAVDDPCIIRTDVRWTPHTDVVCDAHHLPFRAESADFIFSLAVFEHLRQPFDAAQEIRRVLKDGGYCYHECNFVFAYHGYPHHYFNASMQGMEQLFSNYSALRKGIAPYQMPSFALQMVLLTYLRHAQNGNVPQAASFRKKIEELVNEPLIDFDAMFSEEDAAYVAAGSYFFGMRQDYGHSNVLPKVLTDIWAADAELQRLIPDWRDLSRPDNLLLWAKRERAQYPEVDAMLRSIEPFQKRPGGTSSRDVIRSFPVTNPRYGTLWDFPEAAPPRKSASSVAEPLAAAPPPQRFRQKGSNHPDERASLAA